MGRHDVRQQQHREHPRPLKPVRWTMRIGMVASAIYFFLLGQYHQNAGHLGWLNWRRQPVFNSGLIVMALIFFLIGVMPWNYLNRRYRSEERRKRPYLPHRTSRKV